MTAEAERRPQPVERSAKAKRARRARRGGVFTFRLTRRILAINLIVLAVPVGGVFYLGQYQERLIRTQLEVLRVQAEIFAGAIGTGAVDLMPGRGQVLDAPRAQQVLVRLVAPTSRSGPPSRARLFTPRGLLVADTNRMAGQRTAVVIEPLPPPSQGPSALDWLRRQAERALNWLPGRRTLQPYREPPRQVASDYQEVQRALNGDIVGLARDAGGGSMVLSVAVPVKRYKQIVGALMVSTGSELIESNLRAVRTDILRVFTVALAITVLLSLTLAATIARPLRRLAEAADRLKRSKSRQIEIPDYSARGDEIGELSDSLREMTEALWARMDAIERFAADVAHEIKNPLSSLRSAVETVARVQDRDQQRKLMAIIVEDVERLDRLISDVSDASRLDAELSRVVPEAVDLRSLLGALVEVEQSTAKADAPRVALDMPLGPLLVTGLEGRLGQVFRNVIRNAVSFSPPGGEISIVVRSGPAASVRVTVDDDGPGIPEGKLEAVFERFYSDRPHDTLAKFGNHSGLGLAISQQIVQATGGRIWAENRYDAAGRIVGARFIIELPVAM